MDAENDTLKREIVQLKKQLEKIRMERDSYKAVANKNRSENLAIMTMM